MDQIPVNKLIEISKEAGRQIMEIYNSAAEVQVEIKSDDSPLTIADRQSNQIICAGLESLPVRYPIISEENKRIPYEERSKYARFWLVDPLDGTKEFIKRNGEFTVNIALIELGSPIAGFVYAPVLEEMYWAVKGIGAHKIKGQVEKPIHVNSFSIQDRGLRVVCSRSHLNPETQAIIDELNQPEKVSTGSSLKFLLIASGQAELYPRIAPTMEWDTAAAQCILEVAGGAVLDYDARKPLQYNKENLTNPNFIARGNIA